MTALLELREVSKRLSRSFAVDRVTLGLDAGECLGLVGPSGCGKTTTLRLIAGLETPDAGSIAIAGREVSRPGKAVPPSRRGVAMVFQGLALWPHMTVAKNVYHGLSRRTSRSERWQSARVALARLGLEGHSGRYPAELSGGEQQRVALARALVGSPATLLLDEPLSHLDRGLRREVVEMLRSLKQDSEIALVYVSHDREELERIADRIAVMELGRIVESGPAPEVLAGPRSDVGRYLFGTWTDGPTLRP